MNAELKEKVKKMIIRLNALIYLEDEIDMSDEVSIVKELTEQIETLDTLVNELEGEKIELAERLETLEYQQHQNDLVNRDY